MGVLLLVHVTASSDSDNTVRHLTVKCRNCIQVEAEDFGGHLHQMKLMISSPNMH